MANMNIEEQKFLLPIDITENGTVEKVLHTKDTYVDKDIKVTITTPDATYERKTLAEGNNGEISAVASIADNAYTTATATDYAITLQADAHVNEVTVGVKNAGFAAADDTITVDSADATQATKTVYIKAGALEGTGSVAVTGGNGVEVTAVEAEPQSGFYIKASSTGSVGVKTAGWVDPQKNAAVDTSADKFYTIKELVFKNALATGENEDDYTTLSIDAIPSGGFLYIEEGYRENTKISLADLVPDVANVNADAAQYILHGYTAYDKDGALVTGTMQDVVAGNLVFSNVSNVAGTIATADITIAAAEDEGSFNITGSHAVTGTATVTVDKTGYVQADTTKTTDVSGTAQLSASIAKVKLNADVADQGAVTPVIGKETSSAKSGAIATTAPTDKHYVAVSTAAIAKTATVTPKVSVAGYGTTSVYDTTAASVTAGAIASGTYYVGIDNGNVEIAGSIDGANMTTDIGFTNTASDGVSTAGILATVPSEGKYITIAAAADTKETTVSGTVSTTVTEGYVVATQNPSQDVSKKITATVTGKSQYIKVFEGDFV